MFELLLKPILLLARLLWFGPWGSRELARIYLQAIPDPSSPCGRRLKSIISDRDFLHEVLIPPSVTRQQEFNAFRARLTDVAPLVEMQEFLEQFFQRILKGMDHSHYETWKQKALDWKQELIVSHVPIASHRFKKRRARAAFAARRGGRRSCSVRPRVGRARRR